MADEMQAIQATLAPSLSNLVHIVAEFNRWSEANVAVFKKLAEPWTRLQSRYRVATSKAEEVLRAYGWFVSPSLPAEFILRVADISTRGIEDNDTGAKLCDLFIGHYTKDNCRELIDMVECWGFRPAFPGRMRILRSCVAVVRQSCSTEAADVVVPALIAQIDGILSDIAHQIGLSRSADGKHWLDANKRCVKRESALADVLSQPNLLELAKNVLQNVLFERPIPGRPLNSPFSLNRHKIMHGECTDYGRMENVIRAFMVLDFLAAFEYPK